MRKKLKDMTEEERKAFYAEKGRPRLKDLPPEERREYYVKKAREYRERMTRDALAGQKYGEKRKQYRTKYYAEMDDEERAAYLQRQLVYQRHKRYTEQKKVWQMVYERLGKASAKAKVDALNQKIEKAIEDLKVAREEFTRIHNQRKDNK